ncbi:hypothetical protein [Vibrio campbellii]|uniref:hypothetical protein n=1 Tax=Vibrio campbellii TaxID=680 RepID=UPI00210E3BE8|nr:hypothetical protein [Vibrio campbellii]UTZ44584.1 hypothetical protein HB764_25330 [Vibrio campbellii]
MTKNTDSNKDQAQPKMLHTFASNWPFAKHVLNFGGGDLPELEKESLTNYHNQVMTVAKYDPKSKGDETVVTDIQIIDREVCRFDVLLCDGVLNTSKDLDATLLDLQRVDFDTAVIRIDEGNGSGNGRKLRNVHQRNMLVADYMPKVLQYFHLHDVTLHRSHKTIVITKGKRYYHIDDVNKVDQVVSEAE